MSSRRTPSSAAQSPRSARASPAKMPWRCSRRCAAPRTRSADHCGPLGPHVPSSETFLRSEVTMLRALKSALFVAPLLALAVVPARDANACGGCFHNDIQQMENTQVTGHRMILSVSKAQSTLWDQIAYTGDPSSFAWVLPIKGMIDYGVSSDALFGNLEQMTQVTINSPVINCPPPPFCGDFLVASANGSAGSSGSGVTVISQKVVGPYDTAVLSSVDPQALKTWLTMHNYVIPADID